MASTSGNPPARIPSRVSLPPSRRSVSFVGGIDHPDADRDLEREPLLTPDGQRRTKRRLTALLNSRRREELESYFKTDEEEPRSWKAVLLIVLCLLAVLSVIVAAGLAVAKNPIPGSGPHHLPDGRNPSYLIHATHGAVASESETCSRIGVDVLRDGGNAGRIAESIIKKVKETGGIMTARDLSSYAPIVRPALQGTYHGRNGTPPRLIYTTHAPTSGPVVLHILNLLEHYSLIEDGPSPLSIHRLVEALKFGFSARTRLCDPAFVNDTTEMSQIPTKEYAQRIFPNITDDMTHEAWYYNPLYDVPEDHGTTHTSVLDRDGMAVSLTSTINLVFGSQVMDPGTGIILNNEGSSALCTYYRADNYPAPGKRPLSSTAPIIVTQEDDTFFLALGGSGGSMIFPSVVQTLLNVDWGMNIRQAVEAPRVYDQLFPWYTIIETTYNERTIEDLERRGHNITMFEISKAFAAVQGVMQLDGRITAASDSRKWGIAAGY
ncbi:hypothetical protein FRC17_010960 [Serendipita sp. 399]|nr:hypothetical protein FRC17_010960 [Serendipita sp. 399]